MNRKKIDGIRQYYQLPNEITDNQIAQYLKGSFGETAVELDVAKKALIKAFREAMPRILRKYFKIKICIHKLGVLGYNGRRQSMPGKNRRKAWYSRPR